MFGTARAFQLVAVSFPLRRLRLRLQLHVSAPDVFKMASKLDSKSSAAKTSGSSKDETSGDVELTVSAPVFKKASELDNESSPAKKRKLTKGESSGDVESTVHVAAPVVSKMASKLDNKSSVAKTSGSSKGESSGDVELTVSAPVALKMASKSDNKSSAAKTSGSAKGESSGDVESTSDEEKFTPFFGKCSPFSQHYPCRFTIEGISYNCAEQYMMHQKAVLFKDRKMAEEILSSKNPVEQKRFGRKVKNFDPVVWNKKCEDIVGEANLAKFSQNPDLREKLMATRGTTLVEASPRDRKWGIGLGVNNPKAHCRKKWRGKNLLGQILTSVRDDLDVEEETKSS